MMCGFWRDKIAGADRPQKAAKPGPRVFWRSGPEKRMGRPDGIEGAD